MAERTSQWLKDIQADIAAGKLRVVSDDRAGWNEKIRRQKEEDLMHAQRLALQYTKAQLHDYETILERSSSPYKEAVLRQCRMAIDIRAKQGEGKW